MVGGLFYELGDRTDYESIISRTAVLFYCVAFFIFMSVAVLPFTVMERDIVDKEVLNGYYHPIAYQVAQGLATIPAAGVLAGLTSVIVVLSLKLNDRVEEQTVLTELPGDLLDSIQLHLEDDRLSAPGKVLSIARVLLGHSATEH